jgi:hypothetical protein
MISVSTRAALKGKTIAGAVAAPDPYVVGKGLDYVQAGFDLQWKGVSAKKGEPLPAEAKSRLVHTGQSPRIMLRGVATSGCAPTFRSRERPPVVVPKLM